MRKSKYIIIFLLLFSSVCFGQNKSDSSFDFMIVPTAQDRDMDVWYKTPPDSGPNISIVSKVTKGQQFQIAIFFRQYRMDKGNNANITFDVRLNKPDGSLYFEKKGLKGYVRKTLRPNLLLLSEAIVGISFDPEDAWGDYTINITGHDNIGKATKSGSVKVTLAPWLIGDKPATNQDFEKWFLDYHSSPKPNEAIYAYLDHCPLQDKKGELALAGLYLFKVIFEENNYLIYHLTGQFDNASKEQKMKIILMLHWLNKLDKLHAIPDELSEFKAWATKVKLPDPYRETLSGNQQDMLWAEFLATGRIRPIRKLISNLEYNKYRGSIEGFKKSKQTEEDKLNAYKEALFKSAIWSITSNCKQHELVAKYCIFLYDNGDLTANEKFWLGSILSKVFSHDNKQENQQRNQKDNKL